MNNDYPATFLIVYGWIQTDNDATGPYSSLIILVQYMKNRGAMPP